MSAITEIDVGAVVKSKRTGLCMTVVKVRSESVETVWFDCLVCKRGCFNLSKIELV